ncbi:MAG: glycosyltransferase family 2 protein [Verrucomicrobiales bacterium]|nr:glycosyltransferase family 2 protein [Verrucomicrobiales bacterium]
MTRSTSPVAFSLVVPLYNEEAMMGVLRDRLPSSLNKIDPNWELILVNDGSRDNTLSELLKWQADDKRITVVDFTRNFGHQAAVFAGLGQCTGKVIGIIDGDLQDPPELLAEMCKEMGPDHDVVFGVRTARKENAIKKICYWLAYRLINTVSDYRIPSDSGDFCIMRSCVADKMLEMSEHNLFLRGLRAWVGYRQKPFIYERQAREHGAPKYQFKDLWRLMRDGIYSFTSLPLKLMRRLGALVVLLSMVYLVYLLTSLLLGNGAPQGFFTLIFAILFFGGIQLLAIGIVGEYVARIYEEVKQRPRYLIRAKHSGGKKTDTPPDCQEHQ